MSDSNPTIYDSKDFATFTRLLTLTQMSMVVNSAGKVELGDYLIHNKGGFTTRDILAERLSSFYNKCHTNICFQSFLPPQIRTAAEDNYADILFLGTYTLGDTGIREAMDSLLKENTISI